MIGFEGLPPLGPAQPPTPDPRFRHGPSELCQLALSWELGRRIVSPGWVMQEKFDGIRLLWIGGELVTREGNAFTAAEHLRPAFKRLERRAGKPMFFDCEYISAGGFFAALRELKREEGTGTAMLFDGFPLEQWERGQSLLPQDGRRRILETIFGDDYRPDGLSLVNQWPAPATPAAIQAAAAAVWLRGGEGLVLKERGATYARARNASWLKVKRSLRLCCTVLEIVKDGAALRVEYQGRKLRVAVPPDQRRHMLPYLVGMKVVVEAMEWTEKGSLRQGMLDSYPLPDAIETGKDGQ